MADTAPASDADARRGQKRVADETSAPRSQSMPIPQKPQPKQPKAASSLTVDPQGRFIALDDDCDGRRWARRCRGCRLLAADYKDLLPGEQVCRCRNPMFHTYDLVMGTWSGPSRK